MGWVALIGPEIEENLSLRYLAASLSEFGIDTEIVAFNSKTDRPHALTAIETAANPPFMVAISLAFQWRAHDALALTMAPRQRPNGATTKRCRSYASAAFTSASIC